MRQDGPETHPKLCEAYMDHHGYKVISVYSDNEAVEDGVLIGLHHGDRTTSAVWAWLEQAAPELPPAGWHVDEKFLHAADSKDKAHAMAHGLIEQYRKQALEYDEAHTILVLFAVTDESGKILSVGPDERHPSTKLWIMPNGNEKNSLTLLFPDDY